MPKGVGYKRGTKSKLARKKGPTRDNRITNRLVRSGRLPKSQMENVPQKKKKRSLKSDVKTTLAAKSRKRSFNKNAKVQGKQAKKAAKTVRKIRKKNASEAWWDAHRRAQDRHAKKVAVGRAKRKKIKTDIKSSNKNAKVQGKQAKKAAKTVRKMRAAKATKPKARPMRRHRSKGRRLPPKLTG
jgi:hypothetical protein